MDADVLYTRILRRVDRAEVNLDAATTWLTRLEMQQLCLDSYLELLDIKISLLGTESPWTYRTYTVTAGTSSMSIPGADGVYRILRIDLQSSDGSWMPMMRGVLGSDVLDGTARPWRDGSDISYYLTRAAALSTGPYVYPWAVYYDPPTDASKTVRVWYNPVPAVTVNGSGVVTAYPDEHPEFVTEDVAAKLAYKAQEDPRQFEDERERIRLRIERYSKPHNVTQPQLINDFRSLQTVKRSPSFMRRRP